MLIFILAEIQYVAKFKFVASGFVEFVLPQLQ